MATYNAKTLTFDKYNPLTQETDHYVIDPMQGNETGYLDLTVTIPANGWTGTVPYTYEYTDTHITANSTVAVFFKDGVRDGLVGDLKYTKSTGKVTFVTTEPVVGPIPLVIRVIDGMVNGVYPIDATMVETEAIVGETTVEGALDDLDTRVTALDNDKQNVTDNTLTTTSKTVTGAINELDTDTENLKSSLAIVQDGNTATQNISSGQYVDWKGELCTAKENISATDTLSSSNLEKKTSGGFNDVKSKIDTLNSKLTQDETNISKLQDEGVYYGTCDTAAATRDKVVTCTNFPSALKAGQKLSVKFTYGDESTSAARMTINSLARKSIVICGTNTTLKNIWKAGEIVDFVYDGTYWVVTNGGAYSDIHTLTTNVNARIKQENFSNADPDMTTALNRVFDSMNDGEVKMGHFAQSNITVYIMHRDSTKYASCLTFSYGKPLTLWRRVNSTTWTETHDMNT